MSILHHPLPLLHSSEKDMLIAIQKYADKTLLKMKYLEEVLVAIYDFRNQHHDIGTGGPKIIGGKLTPKVFEQQYKRMRVRMKSMLKICVQQHNDLEHMKNMLSQLADNFHVHIQSLEQNLPHILRELQTQTAYIAHILDDVRFFVADEHAWLSTYEKAQTKYKGRTLYEDTVNNSKQIFADWRKCLSALETLQRSLGSEGTHLMNERVDGSSITTMRLSLSQHIRDAPIYTAIRHLLADSENMLAMQRERQVHLFHATHGPQPMPLTEHNYPNGFFVCNDRWQYAQQIKANQSTDQGNRLNVYDIIMPLSLFRKLFIPDHQQGLAQVGSEEAYEHAYVIPVSGYIQLNQYMDLEICASQLLKKAA